MSKLSDLPNIGKYLEEKMIQADVRTPEELRLNGSKETFLRIKMNDHTACFNMLCALEGAVQGIRWHYLPEATKQDLRSFFESLK